MIHIYMEKRAISKGINTLQDKNRHHHTKGQEKGCQIEGIFLEKKKYFFGVYGHRKYPFRK